MSGAADPACAWRITLASTCTIVVAWRHWPRSSESDRAVRVAGAHACRPHDGDVRAELKLGQPYYRNVGVEHNVINDGDEELAFIEIELKQERE